MTQPVSALSIPCQMSTPATNGHDVRQEEQDPERARPAQVARVQQQRDDERQADRDRQREQRELERDRQRIPGLLVAQTRVW